jgi:hypothetical protein
MEDVMEIFGFVAEPHRNNYWMCSPATKDTDTETITCHDLAGFCGSWKMKENGIFFECESEDIFCPKTMKKASDYCKEKNMENK